MPFFSIARTCSEADSRRHTAGAFMPSKAVEAPPAAPIDRPTDAAAPPMAADGVIGALWVPVRSEEAGVYVLSQCSVPAVVPAPSLIPTKLFEGLAAAREFLKRL